MYVINMKKVRISLDLFGVMAFLAQHNRSHFLREIYETLPPKHIENHILSLAFDALKPSYRKILINYVLKPRKYKLSATDKQYFRDIGFLYGEKPSLPEGLVKRIQELYKWGDNCKDPTYM